MLDPVLEGEITDSEWSPGERAWGQRGREAR
jgi:hypothetical protein